MSERKINLEEILDIEAGYVAHDGIKPKILKAMKEACCQTLKLAAENAKAFYFRDKHSNGMSVNTVESFIDKQSILNTINQIE